MSSSTSLSTVIDFNILTCPQIYCHYSAYLLGGLRDVIIELGGEDAKLIYLTNGIEQRMNSACAGGTGAFIDQIASLLNTDAAGLNELAANANKVYPIASRCGVFAKTDIQPLLMDTGVENIVCVQPFGCLPNHPLVSKY